MKWVIGFITLIGGSCVALLVFVSQQGAWHAKHEESASQGFARNRTAYYELLDQWTKIYPAKCGGQPSAPGLVRYEAIMAEDNEHYSLDVDGPTITNLDKTALAERLGTSENAVESITTLLKTVRSNQIVQSGAAIKIVSRQSDTRGILHIDSTCPDYPKYDALSHEKWDPARGDYIWLRSFGDGWFYYVAQR
jgi:hypothetical protein